MQSVKNNRLSLVEQWWHYSSGRAQELCVANEWSGGLKPTVFQKALEVNSWRSTRSHNENLDDGAAPDTEMGESGGKGGGQAIEQCDGDGDSGGRERGMEMTRVRRTMRTRTRFWRTTGRDRRTRRRRTNKIRFNRTMLMSLICCMCSTGA